LSIVSIKEITLNMINGERIDSVRNTLRILGTKPLGIPNRERMGKSRYLR